MKRDLLGIAVVAVLTIGGVAQAAQGPAAQGQQSGGSAFPIVAHPTALRQGDAVMGALPLTQPIHVAVALKLRNHDALDAFVERIAGSQANGETPRLMTPDQLLANHSPTLTQAQTVANYLSIMGYKNVVIAPNRMLVSADGTAATAERAFLTSMAQVKTRDGRIAFANTQAVRIPASLQDTILSVIGLQTVHQAHTFARMVPASVQGYYPPAFPVIYGGYGVAPASNVAVGILTEGSLTQTIDDLNRFTEQWYGGNPLTTQTVNTGGTSSDTSNTDEWDLDSQDLVAMAGGQVSKLIFYNIPNLEDSSTTADFNTIEAANQVKIASASIGLCETDAQGDGTAAADDQIFELAIAQGQTFAFAAGDSGADECSNGGITPNWPASSQYVIAAAGTTLSTMTDDPAGIFWSSETVWSGTGGSPSKFEPMPGWQKSFGVPGTTRGVPDIAFDGDPNSGALVYVNGTISQVGGTSLSTPLFAGLWATVIAAKGTGVGFAGPLLYQLPTRALHDITVGNNGGETAKVGYDFASGRGSIIMSEAIFDIANTGLAANFTFTLSGLTANFTDSSTDGGGTITSHAWTFGDGTTSTATSPTHVFRAAGNYTVSETVTDNRGKADIETLVVTAPAPHDLVYTPIVPCRIVDTRNVGGPIAGGTTRSFRGYSIYGFAFQGGIATPQVTTPSNACGIPNSPSIPPALVLQVTAVSPSQAGYLTVWPVGTAQPLASSVNYAAGAVVGNEIVAGMTPDFDYGSEQFNVFSSATANVVVDAVGYFRPPQTTDDYVYTSIAPCRIVDTRNVGGPIAGGTAREFADSTSTNFSSQGGNSGNDCGIPAEPSALVLNVTAVAPAAAGYLTVFPNNGGALPQTSSLNYAAGAVVGNEIVAGMALSSSNQFGIFSYATSNVVVDAVGYFTGPNIAANGFYTPISPCRIVDTRVVGGPIVGTRNFKGFTSTDFSSQGGISGSDCGIPPNPSALVFHVTAVAPAAAGYLTVWPFGTTQPLASSLNYATGAVVGNEIVAGMTLGSASDQFSVFSVAPANVVVDAVGYFELIKP